MISLKAKVVFLTVLTWHMYRSVLKIRYVQADDRSGGEVASKPKGLR